MNVNLTMTALAASVIFLTTLPAGAAELPETKVKVVGNYSTLLQTKEVEIPFWTQKIAEDSGGRVTADYNNQDILGIKDFSLLRLTQAGVADFGVGDISKMAGDDPVFEGCDLAGITTDIETARKACDVWKPVMAAAMEEKFNAKLVALGNNPPIVFWCNKPISGLADLQGLKVRVFNTTQSDFVDAVGGTTVTMAFGEVVPALQRGVVDCALTGTLSGNTAGWPEVATHLYPLPVGWSIYYTAVNLDSWNKFAPEVQAFFDKETAELEDMNWDIGAQATAQGVNCNIGTDPCTLGKKGNMTLVPLQDADKARRADVVQNVVLVKWGKRCGLECAQQWNDTVGQVVGLQIPLDKL
ncbi:MAG: TRAP transporter substrate-binding protein [Candidatus Competibacteraceae bacterium]|nr:TRAP transporter substrate-binding protein [Candidatus Competibacteraceae bacterium]MCB1805575.1 TRAP transporter substrate-binding protein [Candidatus Competibacteraceae bacterium]